MMFVNRYVGCVKVDGKILREDNGVVSLPFGAEFSLLLKNLNSLRATATVSVDGTDATEGTSLVIPANGSLELERFIRNGNLNAGNRFKFIERTAGIEAHKGIGAEDGLIRIEFRSEVQPPVHQTVIHNHINRYAPYWPSYPVIYGQPGILGGCQFTQSSSNVQGATFTQSGLGNAINSSTATANVGSAAAAPRPRFSASAKGASAKTAASPRRSLNMTASAAAGKGSAIIRSASLNDAGITVPGSESSQQFTHGAWFATETASHVIVLQLRGAIGGKVVIKPVTVKTKPACISCGKKNKPLDRFCGECGTSLSVV